MTNDRIIRLFNDAIPVLKQSYYIFSSDTFIDELVEAMEDAVSKLAESSSKGSWPNNLLMEIGIIPRNKNADILAKNLMIVLDSIPKEAQTLLFLRYKNGLTLREISEKTGIVVEAIPVLSQNAISYLSEAENLLSIRFGANIIRKFSEFRDVYMRRLVQQGIPFDDSIINDNNRFISFIAEQDICILGLSPRTSNTLKRAGYITVEDLVLASLSSLKDIEGLGKNSINELVEKCYEVGIDFNKE